jgi:uncharacterized repeat protein (TIGR03987 family)
MTLELRAGILLMSGALLFYSVGVWGSWLSAKLGAPHLLLFWLGWLCDTAGTEIMRRIAGSLQLTLHTITGIVALTLMLGHALWATIVFVRRDPGGLTAFHRASLAVWALWLVPFGTGLLLARHRHP